MKTKSKKINIRCQQVTFFDEEGNQWMRKTSDYGTNWKFFVNYNHVDRQRYEEAYRKHETKMHTTA